MRKENAGTPAFRCTCFSLCGFKASAGGAYGDGIGLALDNIRAHNGKIQAQSGDGRSLLITV